MKKLKKKDFKIPKSVLLIAFQGESIGAVEYLSGIDYTQAPEFEQAPSAAFVYGDKDTVIKDFKLVTKNGPPGTYWIIANAYTAAERELVEYQKGSEPDPENAHVG